MASPLVAFEMHQRFQVNLVLYPETTHERTYIIFIIRRRTSNMQKLFQKKKIILYLQLEVEKMGKLQQ